MFPPDDAAHIERAHRIWMGLNPDGRDADSLYGHWWVAPRDVVIPAEPPGSPSLASRLRLAHAGSRVWLPGCTVIGIGAAGAVVVTTPTGARRALSRGDHWSPARPGLPARVGDEVVVVDRSGGYESDGWWRAWGGGWDLTRATPGVTRIYLSVDPARILDVARLLPPDLDSAGISWTLKTPAVAAALARPDAAVCYVRDADREVALPLVTATMAGSIVPGWRVPFTAPLAPGVSWSEDPGGDESFGQVCCGLLAEAFGRGGSPVEAAAQAFTSAGRDPSLPHLRSAA